LEADLSGQEALLLAQPVTRFREPTVELIQNNFGNCIKIRSVLPGNASMINTDKARRMLGFEPKHRWDRAPGAVNGFE
jgi:hypothetical protein